MGPSDRQLFFTVRRHAAVPSVISSMKIAALSVGLFGLIELAGRTVAPWTATQEESVK